MRASSNTYPQWWSVNVGLWLTKLFFYIENNYDFIMLIIITLEDKNNSNKTWNNIVKLQHEKTGQCLFLRKYGYQLILLGHWWHSYMSDQSFNLKTAIVVMPWLDTTNNIQNNKKCHVDLITMNMLKTWQRLKIMFCCRTPVWTPAWSIYGPCMDCAQSLGFLHHAPVKKTKMI